MIPVDPIVLIDTTTLNKPIKVYDYENANYTLRNGVQPISLQWRQHAPYNMCNPSGEYYEHAAVCCVAMSMAMVMSHPRYRPELLINGQPIDWEKIWRYKYYGIEFEYPELCLDDVLENQLAPLFTQLCYDLGVEWGEDTSWANTNYITPVFNNYDISVANSDDSYSFAKMENEIGQGYPVIIKGYEPFYGAGHAWVCSAVLYADVPYKVVLYVEPPYGGVSEDELILETGVSHFSLLHHNWGWNPKCTGYYLNAEKIVSGQDIFFDENFDVVKISNKHQGWSTYQDFRIWTGIRKRD